MIPLDFDKLHDDGRLSDKGYYLAKRALLEILVHSSGYPTDVWLYRDQNGEISHFWRDPSQIGTEVTGPAKAPIMALTEDSKHIHPGRKPQEVETFLLGLGLADEEARLIVKYYEAP